MVAFKFIPVNYKSLVAGSLALVFATLAFLSSPHPHYPVVHILGDDLHTTILIRPSASMSICQSLLNNITTSILSACPNCNTSGSQCSSSLSPEEAVFLSSKQLPFFSAVIPNGVAVYQSSNVSTAKEACQLSVKQASPKGFVIKCFDPNVFRALPFWASSNEILYLHNIWVALAFVALIVLGLQLLKPAATQIGLHALGLPRLGKQILMLLSDVAALEISLYAAFAFRFETLWIPPSSIFILILLTPILALPIFSFFGMYRAIMRYVGLQAIVVIAKAVTLYTALFFSLVTFFTLHDVPLSIPLLHGVFTLLLIGASRTLARQLMAQAQNNPSSKNHRTRTLIFGAGSAGVQLALALLHSREMIPVAFIDDDQRLHGKQIAGLTVYGRHDMERLVQSECATEVLLAIPSCSRADRNRIIQELEMLPVQVRTLPGVAFLAEGKIKTSDLGDVEIEDLLGRDTVPPDQDLMKANITGKAVMVTGAGGSIGSELCRQIMTLEPSILVLFERNEFALFSIEQELQSQSHPATKQLVPILGSVTDPDLLGIVFSRFRIETVFHAAAYKHVPMVEKNPCAGAYNNIMGTWYAAHTSRKHKVNTFVLISSDKAVRPTNTMGTTKRVAELILQAFANESNEQTRFVMVRFGNVLGSSGSVVPVFREQIKNGGPITVTDPRITRYFMTIPEAAQLVIQAGAMSHGGDVFVLDMGEPVTILDLAQRMVRLSGLTLRNNENPSGDIEIVFSGLRPGEKLYEELLIGHDATQTLHPRILRANEKMHSIEVITSLINRIDECCLVHDSNLLRKLLQEAVSEFDPQCGNEDLLQ